MLNVTRATLRSDLAILTMTGILDARPKVGYFYSGISNVNLLGDNVNNKLVEDIMSMPIVVKKDTNVYDTIVNIFLADVGSIFIIDDSENFKFDDLSDEAKESIQTKINKMNLEEQ